MFDSILDGIVQCATCGVEYNSGDVPDVCPICADPRQYLPADRRQYWSDPKDFTGSINVLRLEDDLYGINVDPAIGIGQQAKLVITPKGTVMVDVPAAITEEAVQTIRSLGPTLAIVPTHPHMYALQSAWSVALDQAPVWIAEPDRDWVQRTPEHVHYWNGLESVTNGVNVAVLGGHFAGSSVLHWSGADGRGVLLSGDTVAPNAVGQHPQTVTFLRSYPRRVPLSATVVRRIANDLKPFAFDRLYGNFDSFITHQADTVLQESAQTFSAWAAGEYDHLTGIGLAGYSHPEFAKSHPSDANEA